MTKRLCVAVALLGLSACGGRSGPTAPSSARFQVSFTSKSPERCSGPCLRLAWVDQGSTSQGVLKIAVQVQNIPTRGISSLSNILSGTATGTFSKPTSAFMFSGWTAGDFFEHVGKRVSYDASDLGTVVSNCCLTSYDAGFPSPAATDRVSGDGTVIVLVYRLRQAGTADLDPGLGILDDFLVDTYGAQVRVSET
jgi:hypothetical protein